MSGPGTGLGPGPGPGPVGPPVLRTLAGAAVLVALVTVVARVVGFGRWVVFSKTVEGGCLADVYNTANLLPNVLFEVVAGGALAGVVVPVLAGAVRRGDRAVVDRTTSALLSWSLLLLIPVSALTALAAGPLMRFFLGAPEACAGAVDTGSRMLLFFVPQLFCYAVAVVLTGALQAHHRFLAAALAPLASSTVVIGAYLVFAALADGRLGLDVVPRSAETALAAGTTAGVAALALSVALPVRAAGLRLRPTLRFPDGVLPRVRALAMAGLAVLVAQQVTLLVVNWLANHHGAPGAVTVYTWAWAVYLLPYAVLALPIATAAFPTLAAAAAGAGKGTAPALTAATTRAVVLVSAAGAALVAGAAVPVSRVFAAGTGSTGGGVDGPALAAGIVAFAPGLVGFGLLAHLSRVLYAAHEGRRAASAVVAGWAAVAIADIALVAALPADAAVTALAAGNSIGMTVAGLLLLAAVRQACGTAALAALTRTGSVAALAAAVAGTAGYAVGSRFDAAGLGVATTGSAVSGLLTAVLFGAIVAAGDRATLTRVLTRRGGAAP